MERTNFAGWLAAGLRSESTLVNAATGQVYCDLRRRLGAAASGFLAQGIPTGSRVVLACKQDADTALAILGAMHAGFVPVPVDAGEHAVIERLLDRTGAVALWSGSDEHAQLVGDKAFLLKHPAVTDGDYQPAVPRDRTDLAILMPTSGTTGEPRLVMVTHGNLVANTSAIIHTQGLSAKDRAMLILPLSYCFGASVLFSHLAAGGSVVFDRRFMFPDKVLRAIVEHGCTTFAGVPSVYNILLSRSNLGKLALPTLRRLLQAGGRLAPQRVDAMLQHVPGADFHVMYGQTEATSRIASLSPAHVVSHRGSVGRALPGLQVRIVDEQRRELSSPAIGDIEVSGPSVCAGYWDDPQASRQRFPDAWLRTGDRGWLDAQGFLWIEGRNEEFLKIRGRRVSFSEIEGAVQCVPGVHESAVVSAPDSEAGEVPVVFVVATPENSENGLEERILRSMPAAWTCREVNVVPSLPLNARGKLDRNALRLLAVGGDVFHARFE